MTAQLIAHAEQWLFYAHAELRAVRVIHRSVQKNGSVHVFCFVARSGGVVQTSFAQSSSMTVKMN
jgi:hypothetical protein